MTDQSKSDSIESGDSAAWKRDPLAAAYPETSAFWEAAAEGQFLLRQCVKCEKAHWYPRPICPLCGGSDVTWITASGRGTLYAFSPARRASPAYTLAYVTLDEGPTIMTNIIGADPDALELGQPVHVSFQPSDEGRMMPFFKPL